MAAVRFGYSFRNVVSRSRFAVAPDLSSDFAGGKQGVTQRQHQPAIRGPRLQELELPLQLGSLLLRGIRRDLRRVGIAARLAAASARRCRPRDQASVLGEIRFTRARIQARLLALLDRAQCALLPRPASAASARAVSTLRSAM